MKAAQLGMTPARFAQGGRGEHIGFARLARPSAGLSWARRNAGSAGSRSADTKAEAEKSLRAEFPAATLRRDPSLIAPGRCGAGSVRQGTVSIQSATNPARSAARPARHGLPASRLAGAARRFRAAKRAATSQLAREMGDPKATRAVARACALESRGAAGAVPSRGGRRRLAHRLSLGRGTQAAVARSRIELQKIAEARASLNEKSSGSHRGSQRLQPSQSYSRYSRRKRKPSAR